MRTKIISGVITALLLVPVTANAADVDADGICYADPLADECVEVLSEVEEEVEVISDDESTIDPVDDEVEAAQVLGVSEELAETGLDTWAFLAMALGLLAAGGLAVSLASRKRTETSAH